MSNPKTFSATIIQTGIGDLFYLAALLLADKYQVVKINFDINSLGHCKDDIVSYKKFAYDFLRHLIPDIEIQESEEEYAKHIIAGNFHQYLTTDVKTHFKTIFSGTLDETSNEYICVVSKVRNYPRYQVVQHIKEICDAINSNNVPIYILGEKELELNYEYKQHGSHNIYTLYEDYLKLLDPSLVKDCTVEKLGLSTPDMNNLLLDIRRIYDSKKTIVIGGGGMLCAGLFSDKILSLAMPIVAKKIEPKTAIQVHTKFETFIGAIRK